MTVKQLTADQIRIKLTIDKGTKDTKPETLFPGQERVEKAFNTGLSTEKEGYNIYVAGPEGIGKVTFALFKIKQISRQKKTPEDICYFHNFEEPYRPKYLLLPAGYGKKISKDLDKSIDTLKEAVVKQFESKEFEDEKVKLIKNAEEKKKETIEKLREEAERYGLAIILTPAGFQFL
ncbi:Lon-like protease helical domain-containing protein, partial [Persephonella sp.]